MADKNYRGNEGSPIQLRASNTEESPRYRQTPNKRPAISDDEDGWKVGRMHTSAIRYDRPPVPPRRTAQKDEYKTELMRQKRGLDRTSLVMLLCIVIIVMVGGWLAFNALANWWTNWQDDLHYGNPRTYQTDRFVDQGDSPTLPDHFIAININGRVVVVQLNLAHPELDHTYGITTTDPKTPVSLNFRQTGSTLAMYVLIETTNPYTVELVSNGKQFVSPH